MNLVNIGNYLVHFKANAAGVGAPTGLPTAAAAAAVAAGAIGSANAKTSTATTNNNVTATPTAPVNQPTSFTASLHSAIHCPTNRPYLIQVIENKGAKDVSAIAREVKIQLLLKNSVNAPFLRLCEILQDQEPAPATPTEPQRGSSKRKLNQNDEAEDVVAPTEIPPPQNNQRYYLVFEGFAQGQSMDLLEFVKTMGKIPENMAKNIFLQLVEAVSTLHSLGVIHGDLKLPNILVVKDPSSNGLKIKIKDFRYSTIATPGAEELLVTSHKGSPAYLAPEVTYLNQPYCGKRADCYALGVILYTMLVGSYPITANSLPALFELIRKGDLQIPASVPKDAADLIRKLMSVDPKTRISLPQTLRHPWLFDSSQEEEQIVPGCGPTLQKVSSRKKPRTAQVC